MTRRETFTGGRQADFFEEFSELENLKVTLPYSDLNRWIPEDSVIVQALTNLPIGRLNNVKQLSFLSYHRMNTEGVHFLPFSHTRLSHSLKTGLCAGEIGRRNGLLPTIVAHLEIGGSGHDMGTPAHGDATKLLDPKNLDEEDNWRGMLGEKGEKFLDRYSLTVQGLDSMIKNRGTSGQIIDIADRISYVVDDLYQVIGQNLSKTNIDPFLLQARHIASHYPKIGNIYQDVGIDPKSGDVFFVDPERLSVFLLLRAHLWQNIYAYPTNIGRDLFVANIIRPFYSATDEAMLTPTKLRKMGDEDLMTFLSVKYGLDSDLSGDLFLDLTNWHPMYKALATEREAREEATRIYIDGATVLGVRECKGFNPGTNYKVRQGYGIVPFKDAYPGEAQKVEQIAQATRGFFVFYTEAKGDEPIARLIKKAKDFDSSN